MQRPQKASDICLDLSIKAWIGAWRLSLQPQGLNFSMDMNSEPSPPPFGAAAQKSSLIEGFHSNCFEDAPSNPFKRMCLSGGIKKIISFEDIMLLLGRLLILRSSPFFDFERSRHLRLDHRLRFLVADTRLYTLPCWLVGRSVGNISEFRAVFALPCF